MEPREESPRRGRETRRIAGRLRGQARRATAGVSACGRTTPGRVEGRGENRKKGPPGMERCHSASLPFRLWLPLNSPPPPFLPLLRCVCCASPGPACLVCSLHGTPASVSAACTTHTQLTHTHTRTTRIHSHLHSRRAASHSHPSSLVLAVGVTYTPVPGLPPLPLPAPPAAAAAASAFCDRPPSLSLPLPLTIGYNTAPFAPCLPACDRACACSATSAPARRLHIRRAPCVFFVAEPRRWCCNRRRPLAIRLLSWPLSCCFVSPATCAFGRRFP